MKTKYILLSIVFSLVLTACHDQDGDTYHPTAPGRVALQYTTSAFKSYSLLLYYANRFNAYIETGDTLARRNEVEKTLLSKIKIYQDAADPYHYTLLRIMEDGSIDSLMSVQTYGKALNAEGNVWNIVDYCDQYGMEPYTTFNITAHDATHWSIAKHANLKSYMPVTCEWNVQFTDYNTLILSGNGSMTSRERKLLKIDFSTDTPLTIANVSTDEVRDILNIRKGSLHISVTPEGASKAEETYAEILDGTRTTIKYNNHSEDWNFEDGTLIWDTALSYFNPYFY